MNTPATNGTTYGRKNRTRNAPEPRRWREWSISATRNGRITATGSARSANLSVTPSDSHVWLVVEQRLVVVAGRRTWSGSAWARLMLVKVNAKVAIIGNAVKARNPMIHGAMKTYPQRARRQASPEKRGRPRGRATLGAAIGQLPPLSQMACICDFRSAISLSRSRPAVACHFV